MILPALTWHDKSTGNKGQQKQGASRLSEERHAAVEGAEEMCLYGMVEGREGGWASEKQNKRSMLLH